MKNPGKDKAQSAVEFIIIFVIVAVASVLLLGKMPDIFTAYVTGCTRVIAGGS